MLDESEERSYVIIPSLPQQAGERGLLHTSVPLTHPTQTFFET